MGTSEWQVIEDLRNQIQGKDQQSPSETGISNTVHVVQHMLTLFFWDLTHVMLSLWLRLWNQIVDVNLSFHHFSWNYDRSRLSTTWMWYKRRKYNILCASDENSTKNCKKFGRLKDIAKNLWASVFQTGADCHCVGMSVRKYFCLWTKWFNKKMQWNLDVRAELMPRTVISQALSQPVLRRWPRQNEKDARLNDSSCRYEVRVW